MNSKRKGSGGERELLKILQENGFPDAVRNDQMYVGGFHNPDISASFSGLPIHVEVKRVEKLNLIEAIGQAVADADQKAFPVVVHRKNRGPWLVSFRLIDLLGVLNDKTRADE